MSDFDPKKTVLDYLGANGRWRMQTPEKHTGKEGQAAYKEIGRYANDAKKRIEKIVNQTQRKRLVSEVDEILASARSANNYITDYPKGQDVEQKAHELIILRDRIKQMLEIIPVIS